ncbi:MAG: hypothetical protein P1P89_09630 [Desulfobacterales bacterium]|nr:hypothetical protein [Desulfobacterales bacterium]
MKILNILRNEPDDTVNKIMEVISKDNMVNVVSLNGGKVDWSHLVDEIFSHDKVISWW